ncbi:MAG: ROK family protein [Bacteroidota bacterium]
MPVVAMDLGGTRIKFGVMDEGRLVSTASIVVPSSEHFAAILPDIERQIDSMLQEGGYDSLQGVGMAFPTIVDSDNMKLLYKYVKYNDANDIDLKGWARSKWNAPLAMENDARAALVGEWQYGAGQGSDNLVMITIGTGVGSAALMNGQLLKGTNYLAGNIGGHQIIRFDGVPCNCGNTGCLESEASSWALPDILKKHPGYAGSAFDTGAERPDFEAVFRLAGAGDAFSLSVRNRCMDVWFNGILNLIFSFDPEKVIIGGGVMHSADVILPYIQHKIDHASWLPANPARMVAAQQPDWAGVLGAGYLASRTTL